MTRANRYVEESAPWALARAADAGDAGAARRLDAVLYTLAESSRLLACHLAPFLPVAADRMTAQLGLPPVGDLGPWPQVTLWGGLRGALSVALALSVAAYPGVNPNVSVLAYGMVVLSLVVQGGLLLPVADLLRLRGRAD